MQKYDSIIKELLSCSKIHTSSCFINPFAVTETKCLVWEMCKKETSLCSLVLEAGHPGQIRWPQPFGFRGEPQGEWYHRWELSRREQSHGITGNQRDPGKSHTLLQLPLRRANACRETSIDLLQGEHPGICAPTKPCLLTIPSPLMSLLEASFPHPKSDTMASALRTPAISQSLSLYLCRLPGTGGQLKESCF